MSDATAPADFEQLLADHWEFNMQESPLWATRIGDHRFDDRLPAVSVADADRQEAAMRRFLGRLEALPRAALPPAAQLNYDLLARELRDSLAEFAFRTYLLPISKVSGPQIYLPELPIIAPFATGEDYAHYITRLRGFPRFIEDHIGLMSTGLRRGYVPPQAILEGCVEQTRAHVVEDPAASVFHEPLERLPQTLNEEERAELRVSGRAAITEAVVPAYRTLLRYLQEEYVPAARAEVGAWTLPDGAAFYEHRVRAYTTLDVTPQQVHEIGWKEVRRIHAEMETILHQVGFTGDFHAFTQFLRTDPQFYVDTPTALLQHVALILKKMDGELPTLFGRLPRTPYGMREIPAYSAPQQTAAYYFPPAGDGTQAGFYYVNTYELKSRPLYEYEALSLHEAVPGHHLQIALQQELDLPNFRRFGGVTAFVEGWALYAERLGLEAGFYQDPYSDFGRLTYEMWRACRLVVDTGIHALRWTRQQAIDFMAEHTSLTLLNIANEVDRYIAWPGQALAYKMGELKIRELRAWAEEQLGPAFDRRAFHGVVLEEGSIPLDVLEARVRRWGEER
jgi:uncharacterized protein (DUF885 family)